jgi:protease-4
LSQEKTIAGLLVACCAVAAIGGWFARGPAEPPAKHDGKGSPFARKLLGNDAPIAVLVVDGVITEGEESSGFGGGGSGATARSLIKSIKEIRNDDAVKAVLIKINSPGGSAAASQAIFDELIKLKKDKGVKIVASMGDMAASGGYFIAAAADKIVANPATLTGSIGVIMHLANYRGLMDKVGVKSVTIKAGRLKDIASPDRPMTNEEKALLQSIVDDTYDQFLTAVAQGRKMTMAQVKPLAEGKIYTGRQALKVKLVDQLGNGEDAKDELKKLAGLDADAKAEDYGKDQWDNFMDMFGAANRVDPLAALAGRRTQLMSPMYDRVPLMLME